MESVHPWNAHWPNCSTFLTLSSCVTIRNALHSSNDNVFSDATVIFAANKQVCIRLFKSQKPCKSIEWSEVPAPAQPSIGIVFGNIYWVRVTPMQWNWLQSIPEHSIAIFIYWYHLHQFAVLVLVATNAYGQFCNYQLTNYSLCQIGSRYGTIGHWKWTVNWRFVAKQLFVDPNLICRTKFV